jgi:hypothetical protein
MSVGSAVLMYMCMFLSLSSRRAMYVRGYSRVSDRRLRTRALTKQVESTELTKILASQKSRIVGLYFLEKQ